MSRHLLLWPPHPAFLMRLTNVSSFVHPCSGATSGRYVAPYRRPLSVKLMRIPCVPSSQSMASSQSSKSVSSVTATSRDGSSLFVMGSNRVSWIADVIAYDESPSSSSNASNVPMHPRSDVCPVRAETAFHVTKSGDSVMGGEVSVGKDEVEVAGVSLLRDSVEPDDGVETLLVDAELSATRRRAGSSSFFEVEASASRVSASLQYFSHDSITSFRVMELRPSRWAARDSKQ